MDLRIKQALQLMESNHNKRIYLNWIAREVALSTSHFEYLFKKETGQSFQSYLKNLRLNKARQLLENSQLRISEVAYQVGYLNASSFTREFKRLFKKSPSDYRKGFFQKT
jgi:two-component system response regulator YesN